MICSLSERGVLVPAVLRAALLERTHFAHFVSHHLLEDERVMHLLVWRHLRIAASRCLLLRSLIHCP